jgi:predicted CoA-binding protein
MRLEMGNDHVGVQCDVTWRRFDKLRRRQVKGFEGRQKAFWAQKIIAKENRVLAKSQRFDQIVEEICCVGDHNIRIHDLKSSI